MNADRLTVDIDRSQPSIVVVSLVGELDIVSAGELQETLEGVIAESPDTIRLDLSALTFIDSTGLSSFIAAHKAAEERGSTLEFTGVSAQTRRLMDVTKLSDLFTFVE